MLPDWARNITELECEVWCWMYGGKSVKNFDKIYVRSRSCMLVQENIDLFADKTHLYNKLLVLGDFIWHNHVNKKVEVMLGRDQSYLKSLKSGSTVTYSNIRSLKTENVFTGEGWHKSMFDFKQKVEDKIRLIQNLGLLKQCCTLHIVQTWESSEAKATHPSTGFVTLSN